MAKQGSKIRNENSAENIIKRGLDAGKSVETIRLENAGHKGITRGIIEGVKRNHYKPHPFMRQKWV